MEKIDDFCDPLADYNQRSGMPPAPMIYSKKAEPAVSSSTRISTS